MNERQRFRRLFASEPTDRPPRLEEGVRDEVVALWRTQGMPAGASHSEIFGLTPHEMVGPDIRFRSDHYGKIMGGSVRDYARAFATGRERFGSDWPEVAARLRDREHIVSIWASRGFFQALGVGGWATLEEAVFAIVDAPAKTRECLAIYGDFCARMLEMTLRDVEPEFIYVGEPISDNNAPLISPTMFEDLMSPVYEKIVAVAREHGCNEIVVSTYGNSAMLFPAMFSAGITGLWVSDADGIADVDYRNLRDRYPNVGLIGGIPLSLIRDAPETLEEDLRALVTPLVSTGRCVPLAGGRVREDTTWPAYSAYRAALSRILG